MHPFYLVYYSLSDTPSIEDYSIPDDSMSSLASIDEYLHDHSIIQENMRIVYMCNGHILHDTTDTTTLRHPIIGCILDLEIRIAANDMHSRLASRLQHIIEHIQQRTEEPSLHEQFEDRHTNRSELQSPTNTIQSHSDLITMLTNELLSNMIIANASTSESVSVPQEGSILTTVINNGPPMSFPSTPPIVPIHVRVYPYQTQLDQMIEMGFTNHEFLRNSLEISNGELDEAISIYMSLTET